MAEILDRLQADLTAVLDRSRTSATSRKLMKEIEQALKKVTDGIQNFKELGVKMEAAEVSLTIDGLWKIVDFGVKSRVLLKLKGQSSAAETFL